MITGEIKSQVDRLWDAFWTGGIANPLEVVEQITYLLFIKRLDDLHTAKEKKADRIGAPIEKPVFGPEQQSYRWSRFKNEAPAEMYKTISDRVFPFIKELQRDREDSTYSHHMRDARFTIPTAALLAKAVEMIDKLAMEDRDTKGDLYEYMLGKIATAGQNGQFRTPRHIIKLMVEMVAPQPQDIICDPACGTAGFLTAAGEYLRVRYKKILTDDKLLKHFNERMFNGYDFDSTMLRIGSMNMLLHGVENPNIRYKDSLAEEHAGDEESYSVILANPPFAGSLDYENCSNDLLQVVKTKKTELLFLSLFLRLLKSGGRAAVIVPAGVLESDSVAHSTLRRALIEENLLEGVITLPHWVFKPYASVATAILFFTRSGTTDSVWFYRLENDGFHHDAIKSVRDGNEIPELLSLWNRRHTSEYAPHKLKHRFVTRKEIAENDYDLCDRLYLSGYEYPDNIPLKHLDELFTITKGNVGAAQAQAAGPYPLTTSSEDTKYHSQYSFDCEAICIPLVSSTGHGHASIKTIHYLKGRFEAATITAVLIPKQNAEIYVPYVYYYLLVHKDELLVPLMRGAANVSLNIERLSRLRVPVPETIAEQTAIVSHLEKLHGKVLERQLQLKSAQDRFSEQLSIFKNII
jgi:type I restriction-modification system DNA methylase subunit